MSQESMLEDLVRNKANQSGVSSKEAKKALKMLKKGKINMSQVSSKVTELMMQNMGLATQSCNTDRESLRAKLAARRRSAQEARLGKVGKDIIHQRTKDRVKERKEREEKEKQDKIAAGRRQKKNKAKRLRKLEKKLGEVSVDFYNVCMQKLKDDNFDCDEKRKHCQNVVDIYCKQQKFTEVIKNDEIDQLLEADDLSDLSDLEDDDL